MKRKKKFAQKRTRTPALHVICLRGAQTERDSRKTFTQRDRDRVSEDRDLGRVAPLRRLGLACRQKDDCLEYMRRENWETTEETENVVTLGDAFLLLSKKLQQLQGRNICEKRKDATNHFEESNNSLRVKICED